jgi:hypothetical protein
MRVAICISGELRTAYKAWIKNLCHLKDPSLEYYFFFTTWETNSNPKRPYSLLDLFLNIFLNIRLEYVKPEAVSETKIFDLFTEYKHVLIRILKENDWERKKESLVLLPKGRLGRKIIGSMRMFFLIEQCDLDRQKYERDFGFKFDAVMRIRPDSLLKSNPFEKFFNSKYDLLFYRDPNESKFALGPVNDQIFVGNSDAISNVSDVFSGVSEFTTSNGWFMPTGSIHEVIVAESALSFHVYKKRKLFIVGSCSESTFLLRPKLVFRFLDSRERVEVKANSGYFLKHLVKVKVVNLLSLVRRI